MNQDAGRDWIRSRLTGAHTMTATRLGTSGGVAIVEELRRQSAGEQ